MLDKADASLFITSSRSLIISAVLGSNLIRDHQTPEATAIGAYEIQTRKFCDLGRVPGIAIRHESDDPNEANGTHEPDDLHS